MTPQTDFEKLVLEAGYTQLGEYKNGTTKVELRCDKGHLWSISPGRFKSGTRCIKCAGNCTEKAKASFEKFVLETGYTQVGEYKNSGTKTELTCPHGHSYEVTPRDFKGGRRCTECKRKAKERAEQAKERAKEQAKERAEQAKERAKEREEQKAKAQAEQAKVREERAKAQAERAKAREEHKAKLAEAREERKQREREEIAALGFKLIGEVVHSKLTVVCPHGHERTTMLHTWRNKTCPHCRRQQDKHDKEQQRFQKLEDNKQKTRELREQELRELAELEGHKVLGFSGIGVNLLCPAGHEWKATKKTFHAGCLHCLKQAKRAAKQTQEKVHQPTFYLSIKGEFVYFGVTTDLRFSAQTIEGPEVSLEKIKELCYKATDSTGVAPVNKLGLIEQCLKLFYGNESLHFGSNSLQAR